MKNIGLILGFVFLSIQIFGQNEVPKMDGSWWRIGEKQPSVAPYDSLGRDACDFTIYQSTDGKWHCVSCIRYTSYPGSTRFFHRWEADSITQVNWVPKGIFWTSGTIGKPDALGRTLGVNTPYTTEGRMQAPHCFKYEGKYYMFHNNAGAFCLISDDGRNWTQWKDYKNSSKFFDMGRDVMIYNDLDNSGKWYGCFLEDTPRGAIMAARTADSLKGPWTSTTISLHEDGNPESPFMIKKGNRYFLWEQLGVFATDNLSKGFHGDAVIRLGAGAFNERGAPEIFEYNGQYYMAGCGNGIWICKIKWVPENDPSIDAYAKNITIAEGSFYPAFDSTKTHYYMTVPNAVTNLTITTTLSKSSLTYNYFQSANLPEGEREVRVAINSTDKKTSRWYYFHIYHTPAAATTNALTVNNGYQSGSYAAGQKVTIIAQVPIGKVFNKWTGNVNGVADTTKSKTVLTMPSAEATITAVFKDDVQYTLTVNSGTGSGNYAAGTMVSIKANAPITGKTFDKWTGDTTGIITMNDSSTSILMPASNISINATYTDIPTSMLTVKNNFSIFPIPAIDYLTIAAVLPVDEIKIISLTGSVMYIEKLQGRSSGTILLIDIPKGLYIIEIWLTDGGCVRKSFVKN